MANSLIPALKLSSYNIEEKELSKKYLDTYYRYKWAMWDNITREITYLVYIGGFTSTDVKAMSPHERKFHFNYIEGASEKDREEIEKARNNK